MRGFLFFVAVFILSVLSLGYYVHASMDCSAKHGVLVKTAYNTWDCVEGAK